VFFAKLFGNSAFCNCLATVPFATVCQQCLLQLFGNSAFSNSLAHSVFEKQSGNSVFATVCQQCLLQLFGNSAFLLGSTGFFSRMLLTGF
jgi:hypothetical protein